MRPINCKYFGPSFFEVQTDLKRATPGLALNGKQLEEMALTGRVATTIKQPIFEKGYDIDNPNPMRAPNVDIVDARNYSNKLADDMEQAVNQYNNLVKKYQKTRSDITRKPPESSPANQPQV